jgi:putative salt-induced outer membrane protein YdiY
MLRAIRRGNGATHAAAIRDVTQQRGDDVMRHFGFGYAIVLALMLAGPAAADEVLFLNGDRLSGKILSATGGKLVIKTDAAGEVTIDIAKVKTFSTDDPVRVKVGESPPLETKVGAGTDGKVEATMTPGATPQPLAIQDIAAINPPLPEWKGSLTLNGLFTTGNSETEQIGFRFGLGKRWERDRLSFGAEYSYGRQKDPDSGENVTTVDYGQAFGKYEHDLTKKLYGYGLVRIEHDGVAGLIFRLTPGAGLGYRWIESPTFSFSTEAGLAYVYEDYETTGSNDFIAGRLAYAVDWKPFPVLKLYHDLEYLPSLQNFTEDYLLNANAGMRVGVWRGLFTDLRIEFRYDNTPAPGRKKEDTRFIVGVGWEF